jgi:hypothetical protein
LGRATLIAVLQHQHEQRGVMNTEFFNGAQNIGNFGCALIINKL